MNYEMLQADFVLGKTMILAILLKIERPLIGLRSGAIVPVLLIVMKAEGS